MIWCPCFFRPISSGGSCPSHHPIISKLWRMFLEVATDYRHKKARQAFRRRACLNSGTFGLHSSANEVSHLKSDNGAVVRHIERSLAAGTKCGEPFAVEESPQKLVVDCQIKEIGRAHV